MDYKRILPILAAAFGALVSYIAETFISQSMTDSVLVPYVTGAIDSSQALSMVDLINAVIGILLALFGSRAHSLLKYLGVGWSAAVLGGELIEYYNSTQAVTP